MKEKREIQRKDLKHNFLKTIIVRFDFNGVSEIELDSLIVELKDILHNEGYDKFSIEQATEMDFDFSDPEKVELEGLPVQDIRKQKVFIFKNSAIGITLKLSSTFGFILIEKTKYVDFLKYSEVLLRIMILIKREINYFTPVRFGIRKINQCIVDNLEVINNYFEEKYYDLFYLERTDFVKVFESKSCFSKNDYNFNVKRLVIRGELDGSEAYQIILDSDIYIIDNYKITELLTDRKMLNEMNEFLFDVYKKCLTIDFLNKLLDDNFDDNQIKGVDNNE